MAFYDIAGSLFLITSGVEEAQNCELLTLKFHVTERTSFITNAKPGHFSISEFTSRDFP